MVDFIAETPQKPHQGAHRQGILSLKIQNGSPLAIPNRRAIGVGYLAWIPRLSLALTLLASKLEIRSDS